MLWLQFVHIVNGKPNVRVLTTDCRSFASVAWMVPFNGMWAVHTELPAVLNFSQDSFWQCWVYQMNDFACISFCFCSRRFTCTMRSGCEWVRKSPVVHVSWAYLGFGEKQLNDWYAKKAWMESWELSLSRRTQNAACSILIITAVCSVPLGDSSTAHFYGFAAFFCFEPLSDHVIGTRLYSEYTSRHHWNWHQWSNTVEMLN